MLIHEFLENSAARYPDKVAVIQDGDRATYHQLNTCADRLSAHLQTIGVVNGDRVALLMENSVDYIIAYYAILKTGAAAVPINPGLKPDGLQYLLNDLEPSIIITNHKAERLLRAVDLTHLNLKNLIIRNPKQNWANTPFAITTLEETLTHPTNSTNPINSINPSTLSTIIYTSGSTGRPKGVMLSHANIVTNSASIIRSLNITHTDIQMVVLPFFYVMGKSLLNTHIAAGATVVINNRFMYPADVLNQMIVEHVTSFSGVPSTYAYLLNRSPLANCKEKLADLRYCSQAGGHMASAIKRSLRETLPEHTQIFIMYGATEASARLTCLDPKFFESKMGAIGTPIPDVSIKILDEQNREVPDGTEGMLAAQGPNIMMGYWKDPQDTQRVLSQHGYHTGDIGYRDSEGFLYVTGRKDGLLKVGGHRVNPIEIEDFLISTDLLIEAAVIGVPDELMGNRLVALVVPKEDNLRPSDLMVQCAKYLTRHKNPSQILTIRTLPKSVNGKIDRSQCIRIATTQQTQ